MKQLAFLAFSFLLITACGEDITNTATPSEITYLPVVTTTGDALVTLSCESTGYTDKGAVAIEQGAEIPVVTSMEKRYFSDVAEVSQVDGGTDVYDIIYSAANKDGVPGASFRTVVWPECNGDFVNSIAGTYTAAISRYGDLSAQQASGLGPFIIKDLGDGKFQLSDAIGGYYDLNVGYGWHYAARGMVVTATDIPGNSFSHDEVIGVGDFGGNLVMNSFSVDAGTKTISFITEWDVTGAPTYFDVTLTQVN